MNRTTFTNMAVPCPHCNAWNNPDAKKCLSCGKPMDVDPPFNMKKMLAYFAVLFLVVMGGLWAFSDTLHDAKLRKLEKLERDPLWARVQLAEPEPGEVRLRQLQARRSFLPDTASAGDSVGVSGQH